MWQRQPHNAVKVISACCCQSCANEWAVGMVILVTKKFKDSQLPDCSNALPHALFNDHDVSY